ncbi:MAG: hypothetical protein ACREIT_09370, partial [Tepidisphaeraceae bacterium]
ALVAVVVAGTGALAWRMWPSPKPSPDASLPALVKFASSEQFVNLSDQDKKPYLDRFSEQFEKNPMELFRAARDANLSDDERMTGMQNVMSARWNKTLDGYFAQTIPQRTAYLDQIIDQQEKARGQWAQRRNSATTRPTGTSEARREGGSGGRGGGRWADPARMKQRLENTPPARRAQFAEFMKAMRDRRAARGLPQGPRGR